jgi:hypothetical protein
MNQMVENEPVDTQAHGVEFGVGNWKLSAAVVG